MKRALKKELPITTIKIKLNYKIKRLSMIVREKANIRFYYLLVIIKILWLLKICQIIKNGTLGLIMFKHLPKTLCQKKIILFVLSIKAKCKKFP